MCFFLFRTKESKILDIVSKEVDILTEIAELQMKLMQKLGKKADLQVHQESLGDPLEISPTRMSITKENVIKSIKDSIYGKKTHATTFYQEDNSKDDVHLVTNINEKKWEDFPKMKNEVKEVLKIKDDQENPMVIFDSRGYHELKQFVDGTTQRITELKFLEPSLKDAAKSNVNKLRDRLVAEGVKNVEKKKSEIETYKLKVVELKLWRRNFLNKQRAATTKKKRRKEKLDIRRQWIEEQIQKGYMHKSCKILIHSRAKFPFEPGFEQSKRKIRKSFPADNEAYLIRGVHLGKDGVVYPFKRKSDMPGNNTRSGKSYDLSKSSSPNDIRQNELQETEIRQPQLIEQVAVIAEDGTILQQQPLFKVDFDNTGAPVIHYIQLQDTNYS